MDSNKTHPKLEKLSDRALIHRQIMVNKLQQCWVDGVLTPSIYHVTTQALGPPNSRLRPHALWPQVIQNKGGEDQKLKSSELVANFYTNQKSIVILGRPDTEKQISLLEIAGQLAADASLDKHSFIPAVVNLSAFEAENKLHFDQWVAREINRFYGIPPEISAEWLDQNILLPLFDGLHLISTGELRAHCLSEIEKFWLKSSERRAILTLEPADHDTLNSSDLAEVVHLQPLPKPITLRYLKLLGRDLIGLRRVLRRETPINQLAESPFLLHVMCLAYTHEPYPDLMLQDMKHVSDDPEGEPTALFNRFFDRLSLSQAQFLYHEPTVVKQSLMWLAEKTAQRSRLDFFWEDLQPSWLDRRSDLFAYSLFSRTISGSIIGFLTGLIISLVVTFGQFGNPDFAFGLPFLSQLFRNPAVGLISGFLGGGLVAMWDFLRFRRQKAGDLGVFPIRAILFAVVIGLSFAFTQMIIFLLNQQSLTAVSTPLLLIGALAALTGGVSFALLEGQKKTADHEIRFADRLNWSWGNGFKGSWRGILLGLILGTVSLGALPLITTQLHQLVPDWSSNFLLYGTNPTETLTIHLAFGAVIGALSGFVLGFVYYGLKEQWSSFYLQPEQVVRNSLESGILAATFSGLGITVVIGALGLTAGASANDLWGAMIGLIMALLLAVICGTTFFWRQGGAAVVNHLILRIILWSSRRIPFRMSHVFDDGVEMLHLYPVGAGYIFSHPWLQNHLRNQLALLKGQKEALKREKRARAQKKGFFRRRTAIT